jgi:hypothetical protein
MVEVSSGINCHKPQLWVALIGCTPLGMDIWNALGTVGCIWIDSDGLGTVVWNRTCWAHLRCLNQPR